MHMEPNNEFVGEISHIIIRIKWRTLQKEWQLVNHDELILGTWHRRSHKQVLSLIGGIEMLVAIVCPYL